METRLFITYNVGFDNEKTEYLKVSPEFNMDYIRGCLQVTEPIHFKDINEHDIILPYDVIKNAKFVLVKKSETPEEILVREIFERFGKNIKSNLVAMIKEYREKTGCSLVTAKKTFENYALKSE